MAKSTAPTLKKRTGGFKGKLRDKRKYESVGLSVPLQVGEKRIKSERTLGGNSKVISLQLKEGNMYDSDSKKFTKVELLRVVENKSNRSYARRNIITKGAVVETNQGKAVVTNRPGKSGQVTLLKFKPEQKELK